MEKIPHPERLTLALSETVKKQTVFKWKAEPQTWGGLDKEQILALTTLVCAFHNVSAADIKKVKIIFADQYHEFLEPGHDIAIARCGAKFNKFTGNFSGRTLIFNRSREVADAQIAKNLPSSPLKCHFQSAPEEIAWTLSEEINHLRFILQAKNYFTFSEWQQRYQQYLSSRGYSFADSDSNSLTEITADRQTLLFLASISIPERRQYFLDLYHQSLNTRSSVTPGVHPEAYLKTGFRPKDRPNLFDRYLSLFQVD